MLAAHSAGPSGQTGRPASSDPADPLARLVGSEADRFGNEIWDRAPLLISGGQPDRFADLFSTAAVDDLVSTHGLRTPFLRMAKDGNVLPERSFTRSGGSGATVADQVADDKVLEQLAGGATLVLQALHRTWPPLVRFGSDLAARLGHPVQINSYVTPAQNQGFSPHYDTHDVFVVQIAGMKRWIIHEPVLEHPLPEQPWDQRKSAVAGAAAGPALIDQLLAPGDVLYLPRGYLHAAAAQGELSVHLTIGIHPITGYRLAQALLQALRDDASLRASLPVGADLADPAVLADHLRVVADQIAAAASTPEDQLAPTARAVAAILIDATRPAPIAPIAQLASARSLAGDHRVRLRPGLRYRIDEHDERVTVRVLDKTITVPAVMGKALVQLLDGNVHTVADLPELDPDDQLTLVRRLIREGIVVAASTDVHAG